MSTLLAQIHFQTASRIAKRDTRVKEFHHQMQTSSTNELRGKSFFGQIPCLLTSNFEKKSRQSVVYHQFSTGHCCGAKGLSDFLGARCLLLRHGDPIPLQ